MELELDTHTEENISNLEISRRTGCPTADWRIGAMPTLVGLAMIIPSLNQVGAQESIPTTRVVAVSDAAPPSDRGFAPYFTHPVINEPGQAAFVGFLVEGEAFGEPSRQGMVLRGEGRGEVVEIASIEKQALAVGAFTFLTVDGIDDTGRVAVTAVVGDLAGQSSRYFLLGDGALPFIEIARDAHVLPSGDNSGNAVFSGELILKADDRKLNASFRYDSESGLSVIAREGQVPPDGDGVFHTVFPTPSINDRGQYQFAPNVRSQGGAIEVGIFRSSQSGPTTLLTRTGDSLPDGGTVGLREYSPAFNDAGEAAFYGVVSGATDGLGNGGGFFLADGISPLKTIVRERQSFPDGNGVFSLFGRHSLNNHGQIVFGTVLENTAADAEDDVAIVRASANGVQTIIARLGHTIPGSDARFLLTGIKFTNSQGIVRVSGARAASINDLGHVAFQSEFARPGSNEVAGTGIFFYHDALGLLTVAKTGDSLLGSTLSEVGLRKNNHVESARADGVNNCGEVAYRFALADGREGIAIWDPGFRKPSGGPQDVTVSVNSSALVTIEWRAPAELSQSIESSVVLDGDTWQQSMIAPVNLGGESWRWEGTFSDIDYRYFRIRW
jgi:hypothetical protein